MHLPLPTALYLVLALLVLRFQFIQKLTLETGFLGAHLSSLRLQKAGLDILQAIWGAAERARFFNPYHEGLPFCEPGFVVFP